MFLRFLNNTKLHLNSNKLKWLVLGNESSDLDSVVSSLVYSYFKQDIVGSDFVVIPVCCISKDNLKLKNDVKKWLNLFEIDSDTDLIFLDDVKDLIYGDGIEKYITISLLDHHKPQLPIMMSYVKEVIDHRQIAFSYPEGQLDLCNVKLVGSCCTLIASYIIERISLDGRASLLEMLRGVILLDTDCLARNNGRTTDEDISVVETIESSLSLSSDTRQDIYSCLTQAKSDVSGMTISMMVKRDLKILDWTWNHSSMRMAIPTLISVDVEDLLDFEDLDIQLTEILNDLKVDIIIGITCGTSRHQRIGFLVFSKNYDLNNKISAYLLLPQNGLNLRSQVLEKTIKSFSSDLRITRKTFIPIIERFFKNENDKPLCEQINNCNSEASHDEYLSIKTLDSDAGIDIENEGAPYSLNTPLRSYSGSPDNRNSDISLPSLNNRYTQQLVNIKRRRHRESMEEDVNMDDDIKDIEKPCYDDVSPRTFTPENSDDESISDNNSESKKDNKNLLPLIKDYLTGEKNKSEHEKVSDKTTASILSTESLLTNDTNVVTLYICRTKLNELSNLEKEDNNETDFNLLADKVDRKRQKLFSTQIETIAHALVNDVLHESKKVISDEINLELMLNDWSDCYVGDEKNEIINSLKLNDLTKVSELLTSSLIRECLKTHEAMILENEVNNSANEIDIDLTKADSPIEQCVEIDDNDSQSSLEDGSIPNIEIIDNDFHLGNMINERNQNIGTSCVNSSSADIVENSSFNLYRRISNNQMDFTDDEKELLITAGDWLPKDETIYSDTEHDECNDNHYSDLSNVVNNEVSKKIIFPDKDIYMDTSNLDINTSTEISLNDLDNMPTPDIGTMDELDITEIVKNLSQTSSSNKNSVQAAGEIVGENENSSVDEKDFDSQKLEKYKVAINDAGYYFDSSNNNERTKLITLSCCDLPDKVDDNYQVIMQYMFDYTVSYLESIEADYYTIVYFHCFGMKQKGPSLLWLHQSYQTISHRLKKNLKHLYIVHPTIWVRAALFFSRFFINSKFYSKVQYIVDLEDLKNYIPTARICFPSEVLK